MNGWGCLAVVVTAFAAWLIWNAVVFVKTVLKGPTLEDLPQEVVYFEAYTDAETVEVEHGTNGKVHNVVIRREMS